MKFTVINIHMKNGQNFGCSSVCASRLADRDTISFICSGHPQTVFVEDIDTMELSVESWCPTCK